MHNYKLADETLNINLSSSYKITIQAGLNGFSFCIVDSLRNKYLMLEHSSNIDKTLEEYFRLFLKENKYINAAVKQIRYLVTSHKNTLVPASLYDEQKKESFLQFNHELSTGENIHASYIKNIDAYNVFAVSKAIENLCVNHKQDIKIAHFTDSLIAKTLINSKRKMRVPVISLYCLPQRLFAIVHSEGELLLYNSFEYKTDNDFIYFIMYLIEMLKLKPDETEIVFSGFIEKNASVMQRLKKFLKHIKYDSPDEKFQYSYTFNVLPQHKFSNLFF